MEPDEHGAAIVSARETVQVLGEAAAEGERAAGALGAAFDVAAEEILDALERAAAGGALEIDRMVESILQSLARLALEELVFDPLDRWIGSIGETVIGARASGGPVMGGSAYLVGERGPEIFTPTSAGIVSAIGHAPPVNITIIAGSGREAEAVRRSGRQISAAVARAVRAGSSSL